MRFYKQYDLATEISIPVENLFTCRYLLNRSPIYTHTTIPDLHVVDDITART